MAKQIPEISQREENKVMKSIAKKGNYEMSDKKKQKLSDAWEKAKPGTGFMPKKRTTSDGYMPSRKLSVKSATPNEDKVAFHSSVEKKGGKAYRKETSHTVGGVAQSKNKLDLKAKQRTAQ
jgi:hypothetical protein